MRHDPARAPHRALSPTLDQAQVQDVFLYQNRPMPDGPFTPAAVLIAITDRPQPGMILTQRHANLRAHAGQVAFPGGRLDPEDADAIAAALREAEEEIALPRDRVEVLGRSDMFRTGTGFAVEPIVAIIPPICPSIRPRRKWMRSSKCRSISCSTQPIAATRRSTGRAASAVTMNISGKTGGSGA